MVGNNMKNTTDILKIILIVLIIAFVITVVISILNYNPEKKQKQEANNKLNTDQMLALLKYAQYHLVEFDNLTLNTLSDEYMILFALDYLQVTEGYNKFKATDESIIVKILDIEQAVKTVFNKEIDYSKVTFRVSGDEIFVPIYPIGTDAQIYKFRSREYNETQDVYTVYIDCLEVGTSKYSELIEGSVTEYNKNDVLRTMVFKYTEKEGRRILLAYNIERNV